MNKLNYHKLKKGDKVKILVDRHNGAYISEGEIRTVLGIGVEVVVIDGGWHIEYKYLTLYES